MSLGIVIGISPSFIVGGQTTPSGAVITEGSDFIITESSDFVIIE